MLANRGTKRKRPAFNHLPLNATDPPYSAWGLYGEDDELGSLNLLTAELTRQALSEPKSGKLIPLSLPLNVPSVPMNPARIPLEHRIIQKGHANDDEIVMNTQSSSQWDGLRHFPYQDAGRYGDHRFYNGATQQDLIDADSKPTPRLGIQNMARRGIAGRGVLLDWREYADRNKIKYSPFETYPIPLHELQAVAAVQNVHFKEGDILLIRTGWTEAYLTLSTTERADLASRKSRAFVGVDASEEMLRWHWECGFSAVASDTNAYEAWPPTKNNAGQVACHEVFLGGWGMPIGELWDLEELARACKEQGKWTFFLTSSPLNIVGGVASPANAMAIL